MYTIEQTPAFAQWLRCIRDGEAKRRLVRRLKRAEAGNLGDVKAIDEGVWEMREHFGPGWRMYYLLSGQTLILMLGGGDKSTQASDIRTALALAKEL